MIKLIVTDMDGTLLDDQGQIPEIFWQVYDQLQKRNILFCVASGRQLPSLLQFFSDQQKQMGFISENGGYVMLRAEELYQKPIDASSVEKILKTCENIPDIGVALCTKDQAYLSTSCTEIIGQVQKYYPALRHVNDLKKIDKPIFKITIYDALKPQNNALLKLGIYKDMVKIVRSGDYWLDITHIEANKGFALKYIQQKLGITPQETMVFGDYMNDIEMMQMAQYSYAMKNAQSQVKQVAQFVTQYDNSEQGVPRTIIQVLDLFAQK